jgi:hypothetical protein
LSSVSSHEIENKGRVEKRVNVKQREGKGGTERERKLKPAMRRRKSYIGNEEKLQRR